jgi:hypothetical protein
MTDKILNEARERVAAKYREGSVCWRGIMSGQWDRGALMRDAIKEVTDEKRANR